MASPFLHIERRMMKKAKKKPPTPEEVTEYYAKIANEFIEWVNEHNGEYPDIDSNDPFEAGLGLFFEDISGWRSQIIQRKQVIDGRTMVPVPGIMSPCLKILEENNIEWCI